MKLAQKHKFHSTTLIIPFKQASTGSLFLNPSFQTVSKTKSICMPTENFQLMERDDLETERILSFHWPKSSTKEPICGQDFPVKVNEKAHRQVSTIGWQNITATNVDDTQGDQCGWSQRRWRGPAGEREGDGGDWRAGRAQEDSYRVGVSSEAKVFGEWRLQCLE